MRFLVFKTIFFVAATFSTMAMAQQTVWVQIEAQRSLNSAQTVARDYAGKLQSVNGFAMRSGWYAISLGPFAPNDAIDIMRQLKITRQIPGDAYIVDGSAYQRQFWPVGASTLNSAAQATQQPEPTDQVEAAEVEPIIPSQETVAQARQSERDLTREERMLIQTALQWEGLYASGIDGAFGPGTRNSMAAWQERESREPTGVLTTLQRKALIDRYQDMLASLGLRPFHDNATGISIELPTAMVEFDRYEPPFAHFNSKSDSGVKVLLISQTGDEATLRGLYDIMQTLEIVPLEGPREIGTRNFTLTGQNDQISSYTYAAVADGHVKGFTLIWPQGADRRKDMVTNAMKSSFTPLPDFVLPDVYGDPDAAQSLDLLAGLAIRKPDISRSGFYVDAQGGVITTIQAVQSCERVTLDETYEMQVAAVDNQSGLALLRPTSPLSPITFAHLSGATPRLNSEIAVSGYSYEGILGSPTVTYGVLSDLRGLDGEENVNRLTLNSTQGDAGGPVFDASGAVFAMLLPSASTADRRLPDGVKFATGAQKIAEFLGSQGIENGFATSTGAIAPEDLTTLAGDMTVLVSCWN